MLSLLWRGVKGDERGGHRSQRQASNCDNHANQRNANNNAYGQYRSEDERPEDWEEQEREAAKDKRGREAPRRK